MSIGKMKQEKYLKETVSVWRSYYQRTGPNVGDSIIVHANTAARWIRDGYAAPYDQEEYNDLDKELRAKIHSLYADSRLNSIDSYYDTLSWIANKAKDALRCVILTEEGLAQIQATPLTAKEQQLRDCSRSKGK